MLTRVRRLVVVAILAISTLSISAAPVAATHSLGSCNDNQYNTHAYIQRGVSGGVNDYEADVLVRDTYPCKNNIWGVDHGSSLVLPVNIQGNGVIMQLGYGRVGTQASGDEDLNWYYTAWGANGSQVLSPIPSSFMNDPIPGHTYRLKVQYVSSIDRWRFYVDDLNDGAGNALFIDGHIAANHYGNEVWSGFENFDRNDLLGGSHAWTPITNMNYQVVGSTQNDYLNGVHTLWVLPTGGLGLKSTWHVQTSTTTDGRAMVRAYSD